MDTTVAPRQTAGSAPSKRFPRTAFRAGLALLGVALVCLVLLAGLRLARPGALPGLVVGDVDVGGLHGAALTEAVAATGLEHDTFAVTLGDVRLEASGAELGYRLDVEATERAVLRRGRQWNPFAALADHLRAFTENGVVVDRVEAVDDAQLAAWVAAAADRLAADPVEGTLVFHGTDIERVDPRAGFRVRARELATVLRVTLLDDGPRELEAPAERVEPETTLEAVDRVLADVERALAGPVALTRGDERLTLEPDELAALFEVERRSPELALVVDAERLDTVVDGELRAQLESDPVDATFAINGDRVDVVPSVDGFRFDAELAAAQIVEMATTGGQREAELAGERTAPEFTTDDAEALGIVERVSSFTTHFPAGQSRVGNIHRIADLVDGVLIGPGDTFSVNGHVGRRTRDKGFVEGGVIMRGEFVEAGAAA